MVRISLGSKQVLDNIAKSQNLSLQKILDQILEKEQQRLFLMKVDQAFKHLKKDPVLWQEEQKERSITQQAGADDLD